MIEFEPRHQSRNDEIIAELRKSAGAGPPMDPMTVVKRKMAEVATLMALIHGGEWQAQVDHSVPVALVRPV